MNYFIYFNDISEQKNELFHIFHIISEQVVKNKDFKRQTKEWVDVVF